MTTKAIAKRRGGKPRRAAPRARIPRGEVVIRTMAMPADANACGDIFGGWLMSQMDLGGAVLARRRARGRVVTVAVDTMAFVAPVLVGDLVTCHAELHSIGRSSMRIAIEVWAQRQADGPPRRVTEGVFTYVAVDKSGKPHSVRRN